MSITNTYIRSTARHVIHFQFDFSTNVLEKRALQSPKSDMMMMIAVDCTYHSRLILEDIAEASQMFLPDAHVLTHRRLIAAYLRYNNPLVAFYDIHGRKREVLFFYFVPDTTRD
jgi:hypothetical protein